MPTNITPKTHFIESIRADSGSYWQLAAEAVDNSFDASAKNVAIVLSRDEISASDDGHGITRDGASAIVTLGEHLQLPQTALGRFGVGITYNAISAGEFLEVDSVSQDGHVLLQADWRAVIRSGKWEIDDPVWTKANGKNKTGATIRIRSLRWKLPKANDVVATREKLAQFFYPALNDGKSIKLNGDAVPLLPEPLMDDIIHGDIVLPSGRGASIRAGLMRNPKETHLRRIQVSYKHRVIKPQCTFGCGGYTGLGRLFGRVILTGPWALTRFKDDILDHDAEELEDRIIEALKPLLEKCHGAQMLADVSDMTLALNEMLPEEIRPARPKRKKPVNPQPEEPKEHKTRNGFTGDPTDDDEGPARHRKGRRLMITFEDGMTEEFGYGRFVQGRPSRIELARDNPHISELLEIRDTQLGARTLFQIAMGIYASSASNYLFTEMNKPFGLRVWELTKTQHVEVGV